MTFKGLYTFFLVLNGIPLVCMDAYQLASAPKFSYIFESDSIQDVLQFAEHGSMVVFDLDNTLVCPKKEVGSVQWFDHISLLQILESEKVLSSLFSAPFR